MSPATKTWFKGFIAALLMCGMLSGTTVVSHAYGFQFSDSTGARFSLSKPPERVVSLVPDITKILFALGVGDAVQGTTWHDTVPVEDPRAVVGGFLAPSVSRILALKPDMVFLSSLQRDVRDQVADGSCHVVELGAETIEDVYRNITLLGELFDRRVRADELIQEMRNRLEVVSRKVEKIPRAQRKRVIRLMGRDRVMTAGDGSFENDLIRAAGGIPPRLGRGGAVVEISLDEWTRFDPQVIYGCEEARQTAETLLSQPGWREVEAVRRGNIVFFPCDVTCRASVHTADFVAWLASTLYTEAFSVQADQVLPERRKGSRPVDVSLDYIKSAQVVESDLFDFPNKTLLIELRKPMRVLSTLEGERTGITVVGNHGTPPPCWSIGHRVGLETSWKRLCKVMAKGRDRSSFLMTGADLDCLAVGRSRFRELTVYALVTAGVHGNAVRSASDEGRFYEPGTINIIILANATLSSRARTRAVITATEAKSAALQDLDVRSQGDPLRWQATGTGTDEIIVVEGSGPPLDCAGGHCKLGELIARAVYDGVREAVFRQNGIRNPRSVLRRLEERRLSPLAILGQCPVFLDAKGEVSRDALRMFEEILLEPRYASFVEAALALSDVQERGGLMDLDAYWLWSRGIAAEIAGEPVHDWQDLERRENLPVVLRISINALLNGLARKVTRENRQGPAGDDFSPERRP